MARMLAACCLSLLAGCGEFQKRVPEPLDPPRMEQLRLVSEPAFLPNGHTAKVRAIARYDNETSADVTHFAEWESSNAEVLDVSFKGILHAKSKGVATLTIRAGAFSDSAEVLVTEATLVGLQMSPESVKVPVGLTQKFVINGLFSDGSSRNVTKQVKLVSDDSDKAWPVADEDGAVQVFEEGPVGITAHLNYLSTYAMVEGTSAKLQQIDIVSPSGTLNAGETMSLSAQGTFSDGSIRDVTPDVDWSTTDLSKASIDADGVMAGWVNGTVLAVAEAEGVSASEPVEVLGVALVRLEIAAAASTLAKGETVSIRAVGHYIDGTQVDLTGAVTWVSSHAEVVDPVSVPGQGRTLAVGNATVVATLGSHAATALFKVGPARVTGLELEFQDTRVTTNSGLQLRAFARFTDNTFVEVTDNTQWVSAQEGVVSVSNDVGAVGSAATSLVTGPANITASLEGFLASTVVRVTDATLQTVEIRAVSNPVFGNASTILRAIGIFSDGVEEDLTSRATWLSSDPSVLAVSDSYGSRGEVRIQGSGMVDISVSVDGLTGTKQFVLP